MEAGLEEAFNPHAPVRQLQDPLHEESPCPEEIVRLS